MNHWPLHIMPTAHRLLKADLRVLLLRRGEVFPRQQDGAIDGDGQAAVAAADHDSAQDQLAEGVPAAAKTVVGAGQTDADADAAVGRDDLEDDVEDRVRHGVAFERARLDDGDE